MRYILYYDVQLPQHNATTIQKKLRTNNQIRTRDVRLIDEKGNQLGTIDTDKALLMAKEKGLDLVEVAPNQRPCICKIMDYGKYQYDKAKKERGRKRVQRTDLKDMRIGYKTSSHDLSLKASQISKFLEKGHKVRIQLRLRGREHTLKDLAREKLASFESSLEAPHKVEQELKWGSGGFIVVVAPEKIKK